MPREFRILVATDGSRPARAALAAAARFPWPEPSRSRGVVALGEMGGVLPSLVRAAAVRALYAHVRHAERVLRTRWPDAQVMALHEAPRDAILSERRRFRADAISVGWRGHGSLRRLIAGSVSRGVVARAGCAVLVVRSAPRSIRRFVAGYDGSPQARRALELLARLRFTPGVRPALLLVSVLPPLVEGARRDSALGKAQSAASRLRARGWRVRARVRIGAPLDQLLDAADGADSLVLGASSRTRVERAVLGSVAAGVLDRSAVPVLIVP